MGKSGAFGLGKIQSRTNEQDATELLKNMDLKIDQFKNWYILNIVLVINIMLIY